MRRSSDLEGTSSCPWGAGELVSIVRTKKTVPPPLLDGTGFLNNAFLAMRIPEIEEALALGT